jgi:hypothetical protein
VLDRENLKKELMVRYKEEKSIPCNINISTCGFNNDEILVAFDTMNYSFIERFKDDISLKDMCEILDNSIYKCDYKYAYFELKKFWEEHSINKELFKQGFELACGEELLFEIKEDEMLVNIGDCLFTVNLFDDELYYKINNFYHIKIGYKHTVTFEKYDEDKFNISVHNEIEQGVKQLQINRKKAKKELDEKRNNLVLSVCNKLLEIKNNLESIGIKER